jgi:aminomethyltransferase
MKNTPLHQKHIALGAKMVEFAGYDMPVSYTNIREEHMAVRKNVGVFDVSHMGEFIIRGKEALDLIQKVTSNNAARLEIGQAQYSCLPNLEGGIVDDLLVYRLPEDNCAEGERAYMLVVNASNIEKDWNWIQQNNTFDTQMINISDQTGLLAIQGPNTIKALQALTDHKLDQIKFYSFVKGKFAGFDNVVISATGYTGSGGFEIYADAEQLPAIWEAIFNAGKELDIKPIGLGARDTLRLEMGYCLYGNDIDDTTSPIEAGLSWITKVKKGDFNSREIFARQKSEGISRKLVAFRVSSGRRVPRHGYTIENEEGKTIGAVTSGTQSPSLDIPIGMGYVEKSYASENTPLFIVAGKKRLEASVTKLPFVKV